MVRRTAVIASASGLHARPASVFVKAVGACGVPVRIGKEPDHLLDASSMLDVLTLNAAQGDRVHLSAEGDGAEAALDQLAALLEQGAA